MRISALAQLLYHRGEVMLKRPTERNTMRVSHLLRLGLLSLSVAGCGGGDSGKPTLWVAKGTYREANSCVYDALRKHWFGPMHLSSIEEDRVSHVILESDHLGPLGDKSKQYYDVAFFQDGDDRVKVERRDHFHIADVTGIWSDVDQAFASCRITRA